MFPKFLLTWFVLATLLFFEEERKNKEKRPTQLENSLDFRGELMEFNHSLVFFFLEKQGRTKKNGPTQLENRLGFPGELIEFNHSLVGFLFSRFLLVGLFSFLVQKKENIGWFPFLSFSIVFFFLGQ
jgi:hypothetical protein